MTFYVTLSKSLNDSKTNEMYSHAAAAAAAAAANN